MLAKNHSKRNHPKKTITKMGNSKLRNHWYNEQEAMDRTEFLKSDICHVPPPSQTNKVAGGRF
jgi:hypothetical protein